MIRVSDLVAQADEAVGHLTAEEAMALVSDGNHIFIDVRDIRELTQTGRIPGARHCPRGMLEFWIDPESPYHKPLFTADARYVFYCASGWRSALAAQTASQMGLERVTHIRGGITAWIEAGGPTESRDAG